MKKAMYWESWESGEKREEEVVGHCCNRVLNSLGLVWAQEFEGFWVFGWGRQMEPRSCFPSVARFSHQSAFFWGGAGGDSRYSIFVIPVGSRYLKPLFQKNIYLRTAVSLCITQLGIWVLDNRGYQLWCSSLTPHVGLVAVFNTHLTLVLTRGGGGGFVP
jgi:hypothetical protein